MKKSKITAPDQRLRRIKGATTAETAMLKTIPIIKRNHARIFKLKQIILRNFSSVISLFLNLVDNFD